MQTYGITAPLSTHFRDGDCKEANCKAYQFGWMTKIDEATDLGRHQGYYIRHDSKRKFREEHDGALTIFIFEAGQQCFGQHKLRIDRPEIFSVQGGDWRGFTTEARLMSPNNWVEHNIETLDSIRRAHQRG